MTDLRELAERVQALEGPSREVDAEIAALTRCGSDPQWSWALTNYPAWVAGKDGRVHLEKNGPSFAPPAYTASLDAAMSLVPEGCVWLRLDPNSMTISIPGKGEKDWARHVDAKGATPALALVAAALRAIASEQEKG